MKKNMKRVIAVLLAAMMCTGLVACSSGQGTEAPAEAAEEAAEAAVEEAVEEVEEAAEAAGGVPENMKVGLCNISERSTFGLLVKMGFENACAERGWELVYADNNNDGPTGVSNAEIMVQKEVDFVVDLNVDSSVGQTIMDIFNEAGIPVLAVDIALPGAPFFGIDSPLMGYYNGEVAAEYINENYNGEVDYIVLITQIASGDIVQERIRSAVDALDDLGIKYGEVVEIEGQNDTATIQQRFNDFLTAHPDADSIIAFGINNFGSQGLLAATETAGRQDDVRIFSCNIDNAFTDLMLSTEGDSPWIYVTSNFTELYGYQCCDLIEQYFTEGSIPESTPCKMEAICYDNMEEFYDINNFPWDAVAK